ncbi:disease resistance protein RGA2-like isoform X1 [Arachis hypogaea]|uniref:disease resistance protein RGA2-like isoform X1 n=2 Tax=Arachis hypogaea TaxID=3818 RepID=UPI000DEC0EA1|nr:putative disease resistance protein RGA1 isoform X1 [Arachis hypogaea]XP_025697991.1 putative disease resistance protein RGA1 isoform X1 [Arachis hypogaea]
MATHALLGILIGNLYTFVQNEIAALSGVDSQIQHLSENLSAIRALFQDAAEEQFTSHVMKDWLNKLSDAAHVLEDILEDCSTESNRLQSEGWSARFHPKTILFRHAISKRMEDMVKRFQRIDDDRRRFQLPLGVRQRQQEDDDLRLTISAITEHQMYGRDQDKHKIVDFLTEHASSIHGLSVYPVVGMGGLGKTTLARWVFNDDRVIQHFDLRIWVCVSTNFNMMKILQSIIESSTGVNPNLSSLAAMQNKVQQVLLDKRCLLVLDDVWENDKWEDLMSVLNSRDSETKGVSILVTTRDQTVASAMETCPTQSHHLQPLPKDDNWSLFTHYAFGPNKEQPAKLVEIGKEIVRRCAGNPLASKVVGSLLRNKKEEKQWLNVLESKFWDIDAVMGALRLSYFHLNPSSRQCFCFCALYPEDFRISKEQLIHLWMANGLIKSRGNLEVEDVGNQQWEELLQRAFFQEVSIDKYGNTTFKIHDLFLDLARSIVGEEYKAYGESESLINFSRRVHHVSYSGLPELNQKTLKNIESLRTLIDLEPAISNTFFGHPVLVLHKVQLCNSLRALRTRSSELSALKSLTHLRYLNIYNSYITKLPKCVFRLQKLQILKLEQCYFLTCLSKHILKLKDLRHLLIEGCRSLVEMPPKMGELKQLKTLNIFIVDSKAKHGLAELHDLQLGGRLHIKGLENVQSEDDAREANLMNKKELSYLYLSWNSDSNCISPERVLDALEPPPNLKNLGINGYRGSQFPGWVRNTNIFSSLVNVILFECNNCEQIPPLGKLPHLESLYVYSMKDVKYIDEDSYDGEEEKVAFKSLKELTLIELPKLERIIRDEGVEMLPLVSKLTISCSPNLKLPLLQSVEVLQIQGLESDNEVVASFPEEIFLSMRYVKQLRISIFPKLKVLPQELGTLSSLQELDIVGCDELESLAENVFQGLSSLRRLDIYDCPRLKSLSSVVEYLTCLESLRILFCPELTTLPTNMNKLTALHDVVICAGEDNGRVPEGLQCIPSLKYLMLDEVDSLPEWLGDMTSLERLVIRLSPRIKSLPSSFRNLTNLRSLTIEKCDGLEQRCQRETGEDWPNIAHVPHVELIPTQQQKHTSWEIAKFKWNTRTSNISEFPDFNIFDKMVEDLHEQKQD